LTERGWRALRDAFALAALVGVPVAAALIGARGPLTLALNLGPGDGPYVSGFAPRYEIEDRVATHWTGYAPVASLPLEIAGGPVAVSYRLARVLPETAVVDVSLAGRPLDRFTCRGGMFIERRASAGVVGRVPAEIRFRVDSHDRRGLGLNLDWIRVEAGEGSRVRLRAAARVRAAALVAIVFALLRLGGWSVRSSAALTSAPALAATYGLLQDPWLTHRLLTGVPETVLLAGGLGLALGRALRTRGRVSGADLRALTALGLAALLVRTVAVGHPDFYYPDLRTHARLALTVREAGLDFVRSPSRYIWEHGVWRTEAYGRTYAFPYTPAFHLPFAASALEYDRLITAMKLAGAAVSVVPLAMLWALARRIGASPLGAALMVAVPTYTSRLSFAFLPSLLGHAVDMALLLWLAGHLDRLREPRGLAAGAALVAASQLAYVSGVINTAVLVAALAAVEASRAGEERVRRAGLVLAMGVAGTLVALAVYYRDFLPMALDVVRRAAEGGPTISRYPVRGWLEVAYERTRDFFDGLYPPLALVGFVLLWRTSRARAVLAAWALAYALLLLGRAKVPDVFLHGHETLLVTPLVCLTAGQALTALWTRRWGRPLAGALLAALAVQGAVWQWSAMAVQLANAR
jgi:hypothetical protein